jgi:hypothetical protein
MIRGEYGERVSQERLYSHQLHDLPSAELNEEGTFDLPQTNCVYFLSRRENKSTHPLYVGKTLNLKVRWYSHQKREEFLELGGNIISWIPMPDEPRYHSSIKYFVEQSLIWYYLPVLNTETFNPGGCKQDETKYTLHIFDLKKQRFGDSNASDVLRRFSFSNLISMKNFCAF